MLNNKERIKQIMFENEGELFSAEDFEFVSKKDAELILKELVNKEEIIEVTEGIFSKLFYDELNSCYINPYIMEVALKLIKINGWKAVLTDESCLNLTHLSTQNPMYPVFASTGPSKEVSFGGFRKVVFKHTKDNWVFNFKDPNFILLLQAILIKGENKLSKVDLNNLAYFSKKNKINFENLKINSIPKWIQSTLSSISEKTKGVKRERFSRAV